MIPTYDQTNKYNEIQSKSDDNYIYIYCRKHQNIYPQALQIELIQIQSNFIREKNNFSFLYNTSNQNNKKFRQLLKSEQGISDFKKHQLSKDFKKSKKIVKNEKKTSFIELEEDNIIEETKHSQIEEPKKIKSTKNNHTNLEKNTSKIPSDKRIISKNSIFNPNSKKKPLSTTIARKSNIISHDKKKIFDEIPMKKSHSELKRKKPCSDSSSLSSNDMEDLFKPDKKINNTSSLSSSPSHSNSLQKKEIEKIRINNEIIIEKKIKVSPATVIIHDKNEQIDKEPQKIVDKTNKESPKIDKNIVKNIEKENNVVSKEILLVDVTDISENKPQKKIGNEKNIPLIELIKNEKKLENKTQFKEMIIKNSRISKRNNKENFVLTNSEIFWCNVFLDIEKNELDSRDLILQYSEEFMNLKCK